MNLLVPFLAHVRAHPDAPALMWTHADRDHRLSYRELEEATAIAATWWRIHDIAVGDRVVVQQPVSVRLFIILLSLFRVGAVPVVADRHLPRRQLALALDVLRPKALIGPARSILQRLAHPPYWEIPRWIWSEGWDPVREGFRREGVVEPAEPHQEALVSITAGHDGQPRIAVRRHGHLLAQLQALVQAHDLQPGQRDLSFTPLATLANLGSGLTSILPAIEPEAGRASSVVHLVEQIERLTPHRATGDAEFFRRLMAENTQVRYWRHFSRIDLGPSGMDLGLLHALSLRAFHAKVNMLYGDADSLPISLLSAEAAPAPEQAAGRGFPVGWPVAECQCRVIEDRTGTQLGPQPREAWDRLRLPPNTPGEIVVTGAHIVPGYLDRVGDDDCKVHVDGVVWHRTGDAGYMDSTGQLWLLGKGSERVSIGGATVYPWQVEGYVAGMAEVRRAALTQCAGQAILAIELAAEAKPARAVAAVQARLAASPWPDLTLRIVGLIPMEHQCPSRVDHRRLRRSVAQAKAIVK